METQEIKVYTENEKRIRINKATQEQCWKFAEDWVAKHPTKYKDTGQDNLELIKKQIFFGKVGEAAAQIFSEENFPGSLISDVDYEIYEDSEKSWEADLKVDTRPLHVKSYCANMWANKIPRSWTWQYKSANGRTDDLFSTKNVHRKDLIVCCDVSDCEIDKNLYVDIMIVSEWGKLLPYMAYPVFSSQKNYKRSIYYQTVLDVANNEEFITI